MREYASLMGHHYCKVLQLKAERFQREVAVWDFQARVAAEILKKSNF